MKSKKCKNHTNINTGQITGDLRYPTTVKLYTKIEKLELFFVGVACIFGFLQTKTPNSKNPI